MKSFSKEGLEAFVNALQLSIKTKVLDWAIDRHSGECYVHLEKTKTKDEYLALVCKLSFVKWDKKKNLLKINFEHEEALSSLTSFLLLSRLQIKNIQSLAEGNVVYQQFAQQMGLLSHKHAKTEVQNVQQIMDYFFFVMSEKDTTFRELSEKTGLSQMAIHNAKAGGDVRLSSFLKLAKALDVKIYFEK